MDPNGPAAQRFPLMPRIRPGCLPLSDRVANLVTLAGTAKRDAFQGEASSVFNQAALLASDLDLPELARQWCHQHAGIYLHALPRSGIDAIRGLEPLVNLARLHIRAGRGEQGHQILTGIYEAVTDRTPATVDGISVPADLTASETDRDEVRQWLWRVVIADGTRALTTAGRWQDALSHLQRHHGIGEHMLDGRQVAVLARATLNDYDGAQQLIADTTPGQPWEDAVTGCLAVLCRLPGHPATAQEIDSVLATYSQLDFQDNLVVFHTRLVLSIADAADDLRHQGLRTQIAELAERILGIADGYAARDVLAHVGSIEVLTEQQVENLKRTVNACALGQRTIPTGLRTDLLSALGTSEQVIMQTLSAQPTNQP